MNNLENAITKRHRKQLNQTLELLAELKVGLRGDEEFAKDQAERLSKKHGPKASLNALRAQTIAEMATYRVEKMVEAWHAITALVRSCPERVVSSNETTPEAPATNKP